ncbi:LysR family transcriptional regulator [Thiomonas bhubaneswarensis]|uniref:Transcriptional regulator, LysR family n=1 Tax=Thiomonas bhubaneswarensis TaxID=339866 RepID=A0A0K6HWY9_9BURK|nr:LysR family transcriptional regulator [Thiomonas bhubaneswarensis]CUA95313.1 transcriptional regulator, LysR family [Thiomonas bhubaneswarensis]
MELRHLRYFVAVAEERHFSRAAQRLHVSQPPLSQQIQALEAELGVPLFTRGRGGVRRTAAGDTLLPLARGILDAVEHAVLQTRHAGRGEAGRLSIGFAGSMPFTDVMLRLLRDYRAAWPQVALDLREQPSQAQIDDLLANRLDLGFLRTTPKAFDPRLATLVVQREPLLAAVHSDHPLAAQPQVKLADLRDEPFVLYSASLGSGLREQTLALCARAGFAPRIAQEVHEMPTLIGLISAGLGVGIVAASMQRAQLPFVTYLGLQDENASTDVLLAWRRDDPSPPLRNFISLATTQRPQAASASAALDGTGAATP